MYQQERGGESDSGCFEAGTPNYQFEEREYWNVTLDKKGTSYWGDGIINPVLLYSRTNVTQAQLGTLKLDLAHTGWIMAVHLTNASGAQMDLPKTISIQYPTEPASSFIWNGYPFVDSVKMDVTTGTVTSSTLIWEHKASVRFDVNESSHNPLYGEKLDNGATQVFYRWVVSTPQIEQMKVEVRLANNTWQDSTNRLPARTVQTGKAYHVFLKWDGTALTLTKRDGTAY